MYSKVNFGLFWQEKSHLFVTYASGRKQNIYNSYVIDIV